MRNIYIMIIGALVSLTLFSSCEKDNDWNLNDAPVVTLDSIVVDGATLTSADLAKGKKVTIDTVGEVPVQLHMTVSAGNNLKQLSYHDGTWGSNLRLVLGGDTVEVNNLPAQRYRFTENVKETNITMHFDDFGFHTPVLDDDGVPTGDYVDPVDIVFSMFAVDEHGMSGDFEYFLFIPTDIAN